MVQFVSITCLQVPILRTYSRKRFIETSLSNFDEFLLYSCLRSSSFHQFYGGSQLSLYPIKFNALGVDCISTAYLRRRTVCVMRGYNEV